jgi:hypothetical protein
VCTDCHAGNNPYVIHPGTPLGLPNLAGLPLVGQDFYEPLVHPKWPQNPGPIDSPGVCAACHVSGGQGGGFPMISTELSQYCALVLRNAINRTMPPGAPGSLAGDPHPVALLGMCDDPPQEPVEPVDPQPGIPGLVPIIDLALNPVQRTSARNLAPIIGVVQRIAP